MSVLYAGKIAKSFDGSGLNGTWSWSHSNFHKDDTLDSSYTDPRFVPLYSINDIDSSTRMVRSRTSACLFTMSSY